MTVGARVGVKVGVSVGRTVAVGGRVGVLNGSSVEVGVETSDRETLHALRSKAVRTIKGRVLIRPLGRIVPDAKGKCFCF